MIVVLVHWRITRGRETEFETFWMKKSSLDKPAGLVVEVLTTEAPIKAPFSAFEPGGGDCGHYYNVALWHSAEAFRSAVAQHLDEAPHSFEHSQRTRHAFEAVAWRRGLEELTGVNSPGTI
jgi:hypothetical protein